MFEYLLHRENFPSACVKETELPNDVEEKEEKKKVWTSKMFQICASNIVGKNLHLIPIETLVVYADTKGSSIAIEINGVRKRQPNRSACKIDFKFTVCECKKAEENSVPWGFIVIMKWKVSQEDSYRGNSLLSIYYSHCDSKLSSYEINANACLACLWQHTSIGCFISLSKCVIGIHNCVIKYWWQKKELFIEFYFIKIWI